MAEDGEDWNRLEMTILKSLANFFKIHEQWRSSFNETKTLSAHIQGFIQKELTDLLFGPKQSGYINKVIVAEGFQCIIIAAAASEHGASEQGSSLIGIRLHYRGLKSLFFTKRKELWSAVRSKAQGIVVMREWKI